MSNITETINFIIEEVADMFYRFDAKTIFEIIGEKHGNMGYVTN